MIRLPPFTVHPIPYTVNNFLCVSSVRDINPFIKSDSSHPLKFSTSQVLVVCSLTSQPCCKALNQLHVSRMHIHAAAAIHAPDVSVFEKPLQE